MQKIRRLHALLILLFISFLSTHATISPFSNSKDTIIIQSAKGKYVPFTFLKKPVLEMKNDKLNIAVTDRDGNMIQINGIAVASLRNIVLTPPAFQTVYITNNAKDTYTDREMRKNCILDIKCKDNRPGTSITLGLKTTVKKNNKTYRIYATLSGIIPKPTHTSIQSN